MKGKDKMCNIIIMIITSFSDIIKSSLWFFVKKHKGDASKVNSFKLVVNKSVEIKTKKLHK